MDALRHPVILTYHSISEGKSPLSTSPSTFAEQMQWLKTNATVITLRQLVRVMKELQPLPERAVVLTFDDGHRDFRTAVAPVLRRLQLPATIFVSTACCGAGTERLEGCASGINRPTLAWYQIRQLHQQGFGVGAHSISHLPLTEMSPAEVEREVAGNKAEFESLTGEPVEFFAYPYGRWNSAIRRVVQRYYAAACSTAAGVVHSNADLFALPRVDACYLRRSLIFRSLFTDPFIAYLGARRIIRRIRGKPEGYYVTADRTPGQRDDL